MTHTTKRLRQLTTKPRRVEVEWIDSAQKTGWRSADETLDWINLGTEALTCWSVGYLVDEREDSITLAPHYTIDTRTGLHDEYGDPMTIPRVAVVEIKELRR